MNEAAADAAVFVVVPLLQGITAARAVKHEDDGDDVERDDAERARWRPFPSSPPPIKALARGSNPVWLAGLAWPGSWPQPERRKFFTTLARARSAGASNACFARQNQPLPQPREEFLLDRLRTTGHQTSHVGAVEVVGRLLVCVFAFAPVENPS